MSAYPVPSSTVAEPTRVNQARGSELMALGFHYVLCFVALVLLIAGGARGDVQPPQDRQAVFGQIDTAMAQLEADQRAIPRQSFDPQAVVELVGRDPAKLTGWVATNTWYVPYQGALRGANGVLMDRCGNSLDRALLLAELLRLSGEDVQLARATLDPAAAEALLNATTPPPARWWSKAFEGGIAAATPAEPTAKEKTRFEQSQATAQAARAAAAKRAATQAAQLQSALGGPAADVQAESRAWAIACVADHWWVVRKTASGLEHLDPMRGAQAPALTPAGTFAPAGPDGNLGHLPAQWLHTVDVAVIIEQLDTQTKKLEEAPVLAHSLRPAEGMHRRLSLAHIPIAFPKTVDGTDVAAWAKAVRETVEWMPALYVGAGSVQQKSFTIYGDVNANPNIDQTARVAQAVGSTMSGMGGFLAGGGDEKEREPTTRLTAEWIEYAIKSPGQPPRTIRREVFDQLGPAARAALKAGNAVDVTPVTPVTPELSLDRAAALASETELLVIGAHPSAEFIAYLQWDRMLAARREVKRIAALDIARKHAERSTLDPSRLLVGRLWAVATARLDLSPAGDDVFLASPNIMQYRSRLKIAADGTLSAERLIDLAHTPVSVRPGATRDAFTVRVEQGVADTAAEALVIGTGDEPIRNTGYVFAASTEAPVVHKTAPARFDGTPADVAARMTASIADGYVLVAPAKPVQLAGIAQTGWWRVDPKSGDTIGVMDNGFHAAASEKAQVEEKVNGLINYPWRMSVEEMKGLTKKQFIDHILAGRNLQGMRLHRAFARASDLYDLILLL